MTRRIFLSDIDGTLMRRDAPMTQQVVRAARAYCARGGLLALCTGRSVAAARETAARLGVNVPCILYGGASLYDFSTGRHLVFHAFAEEILQSVRQVLKNAPDVSMQVFTRDEIYVLRRNERLNARGVREENVGPERDIGAVRGEVVKLVMCCDDADHLAACKAYFPDSFCDFAFASRNFVDVVAKGCSKVDTLRVLAEYTGVPLTSFFAAGDAMTDLPVMQLAGVSFAPENALETVKKAASYVVPDVKYGGMAQAFSIAADLLNPTTE